MPSIQLLYTSQATGELDRRDLEQLARMAAAKNAERRVTGILLYSGGEFIQLLEGDERIVVDLYNRIARDPRHHNVEQLFTAYSPVHIFDRWNMGLLNLDDGPELNRLTLTTTIAHLRGGGAASRTITLAMLKEFRNQLGNPAEAGRGESRQN